MGYIVLIDYLKQIQTENLNAVLSPSNGTYIRTRAERTAEEEVKSYLVQKFDLAREFRSVDAFAMATTYKADVLAYLEGDTWNSATAYVTDQIVRKGTDPDSFVYVALQNGTNKDPVTETTYWKKLGTRYDLFYVTLPAPEFKEGTYYEKDDIVWWNDKLYTCILPSTILDQEGKIQYTHYSDVPPINVFPDNEKDGAKYWGTGTSYSFKGFVVNPALADFTAWSAVTAYTIGNRVKHNDIIYQALIASTNSEPSSTNYAKWQILSWTAGDNRSQLILMYAIDIALYHLHSRVAPRNIPELRIDRYADAIAWMKRAGKGEVTVDLPKIQPAQGNAYRFGSNVKQNNSY